MTQQQARQTPSLPKYPSRRWGVLGRALAFGLTGSAAGLLVLRHLGGKDTPAASAARQLYGGASALAFSILADSAMEHYRGGFRNRVMYVAPTVSALTLLTSLQGLRAGPRMHGTPVYATAILTGLTGAGFHSYNVMKREGGLSWLNAFYGAPLGAPLGLSFAGLAGLAAAELARARVESDHSLLGRAAALSAAAGLAGTAAEAGLLHFRGAFHDPFMYLPVTVPPLAALTLGAAALQPVGPWASIARTLLQATALLGFTGMGFHAYGIQRNMGGWRNWSQTLLQGPPVPAPPSFTGMALLGLASLTLRKGEWHER